jgi:hypothetical protein
MSEPDFQPTLTGPTVIARPVTAGDRAELFAAGSDPEIWKVHPRSDRYAEGRRVRRGGLFTREATGSQARHYKYRGALK